MGTLQAHVVTLLIFSLFLTDPIVQGLQIPQFLKKKYGSQYGQLSSGYPAPAVGVKTKSYVKTRPSYAGKGLKTLTKTSSRQKIFAGGCLTEPPKPPNAGVRCSTFAGCRADCIPNYQFPNGQPHITFACNNGKWIVPGTGWPTIPSCEPICLPPCQNNGICMAPNQCNCPDNFSGPQCQFENKPCLNYPPMPRNSRRSCNSKQCTITCMKGHEFPDGSEIATMICKDSQWVPAKSKWSSLPDCRATCTPPCLNGGNCLSFNVCQCPQHYRGPQCQYNADACTAKKLAFNGGYNCSGDSDSFRCSISCPVGIKLEFQPEPFYTCYYSVGIFQPNPIPKCLYPDNMEVIPQPESSYQYLLSNRSSHSSSGISFGSHGSMQHGQVFSYTVIPDLREQYTVPDLYNDSNIDGVVPLSLIKNENQFITLEKKLPKPESCFHWGGSHYKTFDGKVYSFDSKCSHILLRESVDNSFSIITKNHEDCYFNPIYCYKIIKIYLQDKEYHLKRSKDGVPVFTTDKKVLPIPGQVPGIRVEMQAHYIVVSLDAFGARVKWDGKQLVNIEVKENLWNRTEGLCGILDGDPINDVITIDGQIPKSILTAASSWKVDDLEDFCDEMPSDQHVCLDTGVKDTLANKASVFCKRLLTDKRFAVCQKILDISSLLEACRWDYCNCQETDKSVCACETLNVYVRDCTYQGIKGLANWRDEKTCPLECTGGKIYKACGSAKGQPVCGASVELPDDDGNCIEGCYCPDGTVLHDNKCITKDKCPCRLRGKSFAPGESVPKDCNTCTCSDGQWVCTQVSCGARCSAIGDPHYQTFDGKKFDFMGQCTYYLVKADNFSIEAENVACAGSISEAMNLPTSISSGLPSCTKTVTIRMNGQVVKLKQNHELVVNGQDIIKVPYSISGIKIRSVSSIFLQSKLPNGIEVWWDGLTRVYIDLPANFKAKTRGLCGTFNNNQKDDFITPEEDVEQAVIPFANKWKTSEKCNDVPDVISSHPCDKNIHKKPVAEKHCSKLKSDLFKDCHWVVDPEQFYHDCLYDMCSCEFKVSKCLCPIISSYANECSQKGIKIDWRPDVRECGIHCPGGQKYQVCGNSCTRTCFDIAVDPQCKIQCAEGCNCPEGEALDDNGECIPIGQCKCQFDGMEFPPGYKEVRAAPEGPELCTCVNALWQCYKANEEDLKQYPKASDLKSLCDASANLEFTSCEPVEPVTCKNMHDPSFFTASVCHSGCKCKKGYVLDTSSKRCVKPKECPCSHGGRSYKENATVNSDCNTCVCQDGKWNCTTRLCSAECSAWGDSHYKTFDGKQYDYQGQCDYVLAKGAIDSGGFDVTIQNVPCGSLGTACSKAVSVRVTSGGVTDSLTLSKDLPIPKFKTYKHVILREKGLFVVVEAPDLGLVLHWDRGTRVYVKVNPQWKGKTKGLCGNYNDDEQDDFQTPSGGLAEVSANLFGDSWKLQSYCPEALEISDTCAERPDRKVWAMKQCSILKSPTFHACHSEVPVDYYFEKCVFDSCACDQGGDCQCLCTALAAYAQECNNRGVPVKWRSQELCPMQCDQRCTQYSPCIATCPEETCDNVLINRKISKTCHEDTCIEGCTAKPCPPGQIYTNSSLLECIPKNICKPVCKEIDGVTYYEGDLIEEDECHSCYCSREEKICKGQPCTTEAPETFTTHQMEQNVLCKPGWTAWINQDKGSFTKSKKRTKKKEVEPLPTLTLLNNLKETSKCNIDDMVDIECRTTGTHLSAKATGLDVECSLEKGLICKAADNKKMCPDFEIRVLCQCKSTTHPYVPFYTTGPPGCDVNAPSKEHLDDCHKFYECSPVGDGYDFVEKTCGPTMLYNPQTRTCDWPEAVIAIKESCGEKTAIEENTYDETATKCPPGTVFDPCAIQCDRLCLYYSHIVHEKGLCRGESKCESGCISEEKRVECPKGHFWADDKTCVSVDECACVTEIGEPMKPGQSFHGEDCKLCQCIDNSFVCTESVCTTTETIYQITENVEELEKANRIIVLPTIMIEPSVTPPPVCEEDRYINLVQGDQPLLDDAFSASSVLSKSFAPHNARLNTRVSETSGGSWAPKYSNENQYLQIDLGTPEPVYGVIVRGNPLYDEFVTSYRVMYSPDGHDFYYILNEKKYPTLFRGSMDTTTPVKQIFERPIEAKLIRINPQTWNNAISLRVELIGCGEPKSTTPYPTTPSEKAEYCDDSMGYADGMMADQQVSTSSDISPEHSKEHLKLNSDSSWQPLTNSATEWIMVDFLEPRNVTGVVTRGGKDGWVTAYTVQYSHDKHNWNPILDVLGEDRMFLGNFDSNLPEVNNFDLPICARYIKIIPNKWHKNIELRLELHGCYKPYPIIEEPLSTLPPLPCNFCPGTEQLSLEMEACRCTENQWWDGENCVNRTECPCFVGHIPYGVGKIYQKEDCSECVCKIGGVEHCSPKKCPPCQQGLKKTVTSTCACTCTPCPENTVLCPTTSICINATSWCDGVQDCPDDELNCPTQTTEVPTTTTTVATTTTKKPKKCPVVSCQPGYKKITKSKTPTKSQRYHVYITPMMAGTVKTKGSSAYGGVKSGYKGATKKYHLKRPATVITDLANEEPICKEYLCVSTKPPPKYVRTKDECPPIICQPNYIPVLDDVDTKKKTKVCPSFSCYPPPEPDAVCNVTGRTFNTFDNVEYKYDICNHVLARDLTADEWDISLKKNCTTSCSRDLIIRHQDHYFVIHPDLSIEFDGYRYSVEQTKNIGQQDHSFGLSQLGNTILFLSYRYGFWIKWNRSGNLKLGVVHKLVENVDGLCGYFSDNPDDDKRKPDGTLAKSTVEFGDSWALASDQPTICESKACPLEIQNKAWEMCNKVKDQSLSPCAKVIDIEAFISRCLETTCACLQKNVNNITAEEECRCQSLQEFVVDCLSADNNIDISDWRVQQDCPAKCDAPLVYHDCYQRKCEPTCQTINDQTACPKINNICFPGCYCPSGYVRKDDTCIQPSSCRDCECNVLPHLQYVTYDENNFTVSGNCVYVMSRDVLADKTANHKFQVLVTNHPCKKKPDKMCVGKITILYEGRKIHVLLDEYRNKLNLIVDSERITDFDDISSWAAVRETATKHIKMLLIGEQVEISVYYPSLGVSVKAPSHRYSGQLEGLCGDCNGDAQDDIKTPDGKKPKDVEDFALSWLYDNLPGGQSREQCENQKDEECLPLPLDQDPCIQLIDVHKFGQCLNVLDPSLFLEWCRKDTCGGHPEQSCSAMEAYARDCASSGFCINWRNEYCPAQTCPPDQFYDPCSTTAPKTCESIKEKTKKAPKKNMPTEGCYCPEGKVLLNTTCVVPKDCEVCDAEGHHPGDSWKKDKCTTCSCEGTSLKCQTEHCPGASTVCERGFNAIKVPSAEEKCCDNYVCVPEPTAGPTCETPQKLICGPGQILKLDKKPNGCQTFICECKPKEECEDINLTTVETLQPGFVKEVDESGCCPVIKTICKKELCPPAKECPEYHLLKTQQLENSCCPFYACEPPKDKCIFETEFAAAELGGERRLTKFESQKLLKNANDTWKDGPCRECKCSITSIANYQATCSETDCPSVKTHSDYNDYELIIQPVYDQCCGNIKRKACKYNGKIYDVGQKWFKGNDHCVTMECVETPSGISKETQVKTCEENCGVGFEYKKPTHESKECCGSCHQIGCVLDGVVYKVGEEWTSGDHCVNYYCVNINGSIQVQAVVVNCPTVPQDALNDYLYETTPVEGECCEKHVQTACKVGEKVHKVGESWPSPDGNKCKTFTCIQKEGKLSKQESIESCKKECAKGSEYVESNTTCCGDCVPFACVIEGEIMKPNETWSSPFDNCTTFTCEQLGDQFSVVSQQETCPALEDCAVENVYTKGCCQFCNITTAAQTLCMPEAIPLDKTVGLVNVEFPQLGVCINEHPIHNLTECVGTCPSSTYFNKKSAIHESECSCCQATDYSSITVELLCPNGTMKKKKIAVPSKCGCEGCAARSSQNVKKAPTKTNVKTPSYV